MGLVIPSMQKMNLDLNEVFLVKFINLLDIFVFFWRIILSFRSSKYRHLRGSEMMKKPFAKVAGKFLLATSFLFFSTTVQAQVTRSFYEPIQVLELKGRRWIIRVVWKKDQCVQKWHRWCFWFAWRFHNGIARHASKELCWHCRVNASVLLLIY